MEGRSSIFGVDWRRWGGSSIFGVEWRRWRGFFDLRGRVTKTGGSSIFGFEWRRWGGSSISGVEWRRSKIEDRRSKIEDRRSKIEGRRSKIEDRRSKTEDRTSKTEDRRSTIEDRRSKMGGFYDLPNPKIVNGGILLSSGSENRITPLISDLRSRRSKNPPFYIFDFRGRRSKNPPPSSILGVEEWSKIGRNRRGGWNLFEDQATLDRHALHERGYKDK